MMNPRENYLAFLNHEDTDYVPILFFDVAVLGGGLETFENGPAEGGEDGFGCGWIPTDSAGGQPALDPFKIVLDDVCDWEDVVKFPDLDAFDWESYSEQLLADVDRTQKAVEYHSWNSIFERFTHLLGFENALCSLYEEPEASQALIDAITDYKIRNIEYADKYFHADAYVTYDDLATERSTFMSPEVYRQFFKEPHKRLADAIKDMGAIPIKHTCGRCEEILDDYIDEGIAAWQAAQPSNDLEGIIRDKGRKIGVVGGFDSQGKPAAIGADPALTAADVRRCFEEYGCFGYGYAFFGFFVGFPEDTQERYGVMFQTLQELRAEGK